MVETKLNLNLSQGYVEVSGSEEFVKSIYEDIKNNLFTQKMEPKIANSIYDGEKDSKKTIKKNTGLSTKPKLISELDLYPKDKEKFKDFFNKYDLKTFFEKNLVIVYYLQEILKLNEITMDMVYTCYKDIGGKYPEQLKQSLTDTKTQKNWLVHENGSNIKLTSKGENAFVDLKLKDES